MGAITDMLEPFRYKVPFCPDWVFWPGDTGPWLANMRRRFGFVCCCEKNHYCCLKPQRAVQRSPRLLVRVPIFESFLIKWQWFLTAGNVCFCHSCLCFAVSFFLLISSGVSTRCVDSRCRTGTAYGRQHLCRHSCLWFKVEQNVPTYFNANARRGNSNEISHRVDFQRVSTLLCGFSFWNWHSVVWTPTAKHKDPTWHSRYNNSLHSGSSLNSNQFFKLIPAELGSTFLHYWDL